MIASASESCSFPFSVGKALDAESFATVRRRLILDGCKWDPQVGDTQTLAPFPLILSEEAWSDLQAKARALYSELLAAEGEVLARPQLMQPLGLPRPIRKLLSKSRLPVSPAAMRVMRFDFHFTNEGWKISEVNNDVPGGFTEASSFSSFFLPVFSGCAVLRKSDENLDSSAFRAGDGRDGGAICRAWVHGRSAGDEFFVRPIDARWDSRVPADARTARVARWPAVS